MFTYVEANSSASNADYLSAVRALIQDTIEAEQEFSDAEIEAQYSETDASATQKVRNYTTAVTLVRLLHRRYSKQASFSSQGTSVQLLERAKYWQQMVNDLGDELRVAHMEAGNVDQGGILYAGRDTSFLDSTGEALGASHYGGTLGGIIT